MEERSLEGQNCNLEVFGAKLELLKVLGVKLEFWKACRGISVNTECVEGLSIKR
jgi:hypothetical protein